MNYHYESSLFGYPRDSSKYAQNIQEIEKTAENALRNISLIYDEIMTPKKSILEVEIVDSDLDESPLYSHREQNYFLKTCCNTVKEFCVKCDRCISRCSSCNRCNCSLNTNSIKAKSNRSSDDIYRPVSANESTFGLNCTIPKPFSFYSKSEERQKAKENKISRIKQDLEKEVENELKVRAICKPVPKSTHLPLYNQMVQEKEKHKLKRKEYCLEILKNTKPFHLHPSSKSIIKTKSSLNLTSENAHFKAKPVPKHILSNKVSERLKNKEEIRKMLMTERAKQTIEKSSLPFSQKNVIYSRSLIDLYNLNNAQNKEESKPKNIAEISKRLYMKKCSETMDNWNKKVLQVDMNKKMVNQDLLNGYEPTSKRQLTKTEELPFMYFPVRMSNAALLREKQIRAEIMARKEREKRTKMEEELAKKKVNADILHKLKDLIPPSEGEKEIDEKVKNFKESQIRRDQEYEKELEEIMKRVSEQTLLLERQSKIKQVTPTRTLYSDKSNETGDNDAQESIASDTITNSSTES